MNFDGKTIIVTGASSGIGEGIARDLGARGANVVLAARRADRLEAIAQEIGPDRALSVATDITNPDEVAALVARATDRFGALHGLVANAGTAAMGRMEDLDPADFRKLLDINVEGTYTTIRAAWGLLKASGGAVVATSSVSGLGGDWGAFAYNASKGAISLMVQGLALDAHASGIRVNAVAPSFTLSELTEGMTDDKALMDAFKTRIPLGRPADPADIAGPVAFLLSPEARFVNGVILPVDGGLNASNGQPPLG